TERASGQARLVTSHCHLVGGVLSEMSERRIHGGGQQALPLDVFPAGLDYVALGHLHRAQCVGKRKDLRYSGSPIPLSMSEADYCHQILQLDFDQGDLVEIQSHSVPRTVGMKRIQCALEGGVEQALAEIESLPAANELEAYQWPYLEIQLRLDRPGSQLQRRLRSACEERAVRLVKISVKIEGCRAQSTEAQPTLLEDWTPEQVFQERWRRQFDRAPEPEMLALFRESLRAVQEEK
ncbi:MAG: exonuclease SbcCD subunit D C-terminal domain-containing protein, partial [Myxococcales bacterium]|nr:exonuclease SbcCD subunit D C-terminal domain-containing protein [Myxococcales bacterium]